MSKKPSIGPKALDLFKLTKDLPFGYDLKVELPVQTVIMLATILEEMNIEFGSPDMFRSNKFVMLQVEMLIAEVRSQHPDFVEDLASQRESVDAP